MAGTRSRSLTPRKCFRDLAAPQTGWPIVDGGIPETVV